MFSDIGDSYRIYRAGELVSLNKCKGSHHLVKNGVLLHCRFPLWLLLAWPSEVWGTPTHVIHVNSHTQNPNHADCTGCWDVERETEQVDTGSSRTSTRLLKSNPVKDENIWYSVDALLRARSGAKNIWGQNVLSCSCIFNPEVGLALAWSRVD